MTNERRPTIRILQLEGAVSCSVIPLPPSPTRPFIKLRSRCVLPPPTHLCTQLSAYCLEVSGKLLHLHAGRWERVIRGLGKGKVSEQT